MILKNRNFESKKVQLNGCDGVSHLELEEKNLLRAILNLWHVSLYEYPKAIQKTLFTFSPCYFQYPYSPAHYEDEDNCPNG